MKALRYRGAVLALAATAILAVAAFANVYLLDFTGYDYWQPSGCYNAVGFVPAVNPDYLSFDYSTNQYTFSLQNMCAASIDTVSGYIVYSFSSGTFDVYCDSLAGGTAADYGTNPPNATAPSTFEDGECVLGGDITSFSIVYDPSTGTGDLDGMMSLNRGTQLSSIPPDQRTGWTLAAVRDDTPELPAGYRWQITGRVSINEPVPTRPTTWGHLKQHYTGGE